jgi:hypothetical protein
MQTKAPWLKPGIWGAILGSIATMIIGFAWMGWVLGGTADRIALERSNAAVVTALTPSCVSSFMQQPDAAAKLKELKATDIWRQREFVETGGWATPTGEKHPNSSLAGACADQLAKMKI